MKPLINLPIRAKLMLGFALVAAGIFTATAVAIFEFKGAAWNSAIATEIITLENSLNRQRADVLGMFLTSDRAKQEDAIKELKLFSSEGDAAFAQLLKLVGTDAPLVSRISAVTKTRQEFNETRDSIIIPAILEGKNETAQVLATGIQRKRYQEMREDLRLLGQHAATMAGQRASRSQFFFISMGLSMLALAWGLYAAANSLLVRPLMHLTMAADRIAEGDLSVHLAETSRRDEVGVLTSSFGRMINSLRDMSSASSKIAAGDLRVTIQPRSAHDTLGQAFADMVKNLRRLTSDMATAIEVLGTAVNEITTSARQMAAGSTQCAAAVMETRQTVEEVRQAAGVASERAERIVEQSQNSLHVAHQGGKAVETTKERVDTIRQQMEFIGASMNRLTEQTHDIGDIIATVDDIADQSNLLAVNAAIEASKAGEHGRGFAIVAQEVRGLAERSRRATNEVRRILGEIQKATTAAVMAAEQGGKAVQAGVAQSILAGEALRATAANVVESTQAVGHIALTSRQQLAGVEQVATAMSSIESATTQAMGGARELEVSARNLSALARTLRDMISNYRTA